MVCTISNIARKGQPEHFRILVAENSEEIFHDSATNMHDALEILVSFLNSKRSREEVYKFTTWEGVDPDELTMYSEDSMGLERE